MGWVGGGGALAWVTVRHFYAPKTHFESADTHLHLLLTLSAPIIGTDRASSYLAEQFRLKALRSAGETRVFHGTNALFRVNNSTN